MTLRWAVFALCCLAAGEAAAGIIQGHGGAIEVTSQEGEGTRFVIRLPLHRLRTRNRILGYAK